MTDQDYIKLMSNTAEEQRILGSVAQAMSAVVRTTSLAIQHEWISRPAGGSSAAFTSNLFDLGTPLHRCAYGIPGAPLWLLPAFNYSAPGRGVFALSGALPTPALSWAPSDLTKRILVHMHMRRLRVVLPPQLPTNYAGVTFPDGFGEEWTLKNPVLCRTLLRSIGDDKGGNPTILWGDIGGGVANYALLDRPFSITASTMTPYIQTVYPKSTAGLMYVEFVGPNMESWKVLTDVVELARILISTPLRSDSTIYAGPSAGDATSRTLCYIRKGTSATGKLRLTVKMAAPLLPAQKPLICYSKGITPVYWDMPAWDGSVIANYLSSVNSGYAAIANVVASINDLTPPAPVVATAESTLGWVTALMPLGLFLLSNSQQQKNPTRHESIQQSRQIYAHGNALPEAPQEPRARANRRSASRSRESISS